jgi:hypothetical protein
MNRAAPWAGGEARRALAARLKGRARRFHRPGALGAVNAASAILEVPPPREHRCEVLRFAAEAYVLK